MDLKKLKMTPPWEWPEETDKALLEVLNNNQADPADRVLAAELAGDFVVINDELAGVLLSILQNGSEPEELRAIAAISFGPALEQADIEEFDDPDDVPISENVFHKIQKSLQSLYMDADVPEYVRRRILEASVRAPESWHQNAVRSAYCSNDKEWKLTAVFSMRWITGFDDQILESLKNNNENIHYEAVCAAGNWEVDAAWSHVAGLVKAKGTDKLLLLAAIDAVASIRPHEARTVLIGLTSLEDEDIVEASYEAMAMAEVLSNHELDDDDDGDDGFIH